VSPETVDVQVGELDLAWAEAESALPADNWSVVGVWRYRVQGKRGPEEWHATALSYPRTGGDDEHGEGPTPAAALRSLAARLREQSA
jgi:hypothetical protein